uniref:Ig-like domain-containing protein n=1 Tax=Xiphophorus maculatus TaxID=8083 RepID=A0A3B5Q2A4_XIPMA
MDLKSCYAMISISEKPRATLTAGPTSIPVGGSVTLSCSMEPSAGWKYRWFRRTSDTPEAEITTNKEDNSVITVTQGGIYRCAGCPKPNSFFSLSLILCCCNFGESITLTCEVQGGETTEWTCEWRRSGSIIHKTDSKDWTSDKHFRVEALSTHDSGEFHCCGHWTGSSYENCSKTVTVTVSDRPTATLTAGSTTIPVGSSVTLSCSVEPSAGWKYRWFRRTSDSSFVEFSRNNEENREITVTQGGIYKCDGKRGNPSFYSHSSQENNIQIMCKFFL